MLGVLIGLLAGLALGLAAGHLLWRRAPQQSSLPVTEPVQTQTGVELVPALEEEIQIDSVAVTEARETLERCLGSCYLDAEQRQWAEDALRFLHAGRLSEARDALQVVLRTCGNPRTVQYLRASLQLLEG